MVAVSVRPWELVVVTVTMVWSKETPGFRDPRKVKVEWVSVTGEEPYYKQKAADWITRSEQLAKSEIWGFTVPTFGFGAGVVQIRSYPKSSFRDPRRLVRLPATVS